MFKYSICVQIVIQTAKFKAMHSATTNLVLPRAISFY